MPELGHQLILSRCPHCGVDRPSLNLVAQFETKNFQGNSARIWNSYACTRCGGVISAWAIKGSISICEMYPAPMDVDEAIPGRAKEYLEQAINSISAPAGAVMLAASSVDAMLKNKGLNDGSLYSRIEKAVTEHLITSEMGKWAHSVRLDANDQRHADNDAALPNENGAKKVIDFVQALGTFLFVLPARVNRGIQDAENS
jgi:DNA-directed RNA polymerase subunit RPC12/RpoP